MANMDMPRALTNFPLVEYETMDVRASNVCAHNQVNHGPLEPYSLVSREVLLSAKIESPVSVTCSGDDAFFGDVAMNLSSEFQIIA